MASYPLWPVSQADPSIEHLEHQELEDTAKVAALRDAGEKGWSALASGRYDDIADENLDDFIGQLGVRAARNQPAG